MNVANMIPVMAVCCYLFLLLALMASRKSRLITAFMWVLISSVLWTGGAFLMRQHVPPNTKLWYDISIFGVMMLAYALLRFFQEFAGHKAGRMTWVWAVLLAIAFTYNLLTGRLLAAPTYVPNDGGGAFVYTITWHIAVLALLLSAVVVHALIIVYRMQRSDAVRARAFLPIAVGLICLLIGHGLLILPAFSGFPVDVLSGVVFVALIYYALYRRRLLRLDLLISRGTSYFMAAVFSTVLFSFLLRDMENFISSNTLLGEGSDLLLVALAFFAVTILIYTVMKRFIDTVFVRDSNLREDALRQFSTTAANSLEFSQVSGELVRVILKTIPVRNVYVVVANPQETHVRIVDSANPLENRVTRLRTNTPVINALSHEKQGECLLMDEFNRTPQYRAMWEEEKKELDALDVACIMPLGGDGRLAGAVLLGRKERNAPYTLDDVSFLSSVGSVAAIAVKNAQLYEHARQEARTDDLTGLVNRKYFLQQVDAQAAARAGQSLALITLNIDNFKLYNQLYGNQAGDEALKEIAVILKGSVGGHGTVARYGGKEFAILLPGYDILSAKSLAENIRTQLKSINREPGPDKVRKRAITFSGGICAIPYGASTANELLSNTDLAIFQVKRSGRNAIQLCTGGRIEDTQDGTKRSDLISEIYSGYASTIHALTATIDTKDHYTFSHSNNVAYYASEFALALGMSPETAEIVREAALLHDIGKIGIDEQILNKKGRLTDEEMALMREHVTKSVSIISHLPSLDYVIPAVIGHHERFDGKGYPRGLSGEDIPLPARLLCIVDAFDAMLSYRTYKTSSSVNEALKKLESGSGAQFDPRLVSQFVALIREGRIQVIPTTGEPKPA